eukprot:gene1129-15398_t
MVGFTNVCAARAHDGEVFVAFVALGSTGEKGVYVHHPASGATDLCAAGGAVYQDFPFEPSCADGM